MERLKAVLIEIGGLSADVTAYLLGIDLIQKVVGRGESLYNKMSEISGMQMMIESLEVLQGDVKRIERYLENLERPRGFALFAKLQDYLSLGNFDEGFRKRLATVISNILAHDKFEEMFDHHQSMVGIITTLSPQAIVILIDIKSWPPFPVSQSPNSTGYYSPAWHDEYVRQCRRPLNHVQRRSLLHALNELEQKRLIAGQDIGSGKCKPIPVGVSPELIQFLQ